MPRCAVIIHGKYCHCKNEPRYYDGEGWRCLSHSRLHVNGRPVKVELDRGPEDWQRVLASVKIRNKTKPRTKPRFVKMHPFKKTTTH